MSAATTFDLIQGIEGSIKPMDIASSTAWLGGLNMWAGRLWQSMQSMARIWLGSGVPVYPSTRYSVTFPLGSVVRTHGMICRCSSSAGRLHMRFTIPDAPRPIAELQALVPVDRAQRVLRPVGDRFDNQVLQPLARTIAVLPPNTIGTKTMMVVSVAATHVHLKTLAAFDEAAKGLAHEIRNPLGAMRGAIQMLESKMPPESLQAGLMDIILKESDRLNNIITNFLGYARPAAGDFNHAITRGIQTGIDAEDSFEGQEDDRMEA